MLHGCSGALLVCVLGACARSTPGSSADGALDPDASTDAQASVDARAPDGSSPDADVPVDSAVPADSAVPVDAAVAPDAAPTFPEVTSSTRGWSSIGGTRPGYEYGPAIVLEDGTVHAFYCSSPTVTGWDTIRLASSADGLTWTTPTDALVPGDAYDLDSACDPTVVRFRGVYLMYYTCINTTSAPDGYGNNRVCVAAADQVTGPYRKLSEPVVEDLNCPGDAAASYCLGQPSAVVVGDQVYLYYSNAYPGDPGPGPGKIFLSTSADGIQFSLANGGAAVWDHRDVDVKRDRRSGLFLMVQGEVDTQTIVWTASWDGITWLPYDPARAISSNTDMPIDGQNHNPGLAGDPLGAFDGMTFVIYGSSYESGWGLWHLYRSDLVVDPDQNDCSQCVSGSCDLGCSTALGGSATGYCGVPGSTDPGACCSCTAVAPEPDCSVCAPGGCVAACRAAGFSIGMCGAPGSTDPAVCCSCD